MVMPPLKIRAIIFDLGGTLVDWPDWDGETLRRWSRTYSYLIELAPLGSLKRADFVDAMHTAEGHYWSMVEQYHVSSTAPQLIQHGFHRLRMQASSHMLQLACKSYGCAVRDWTVLYPDTLPTLLELRRQGYRLGLLSNTWWPASWHQSDLVRHDIDQFFDAVIYSSDLAYSKPHPHVFCLAASQLGVKPEQCVMVGNRLTTDIKGGQLVGMHSIWKRPSSPWIEPAGIVPGVTIHQLAELIPLLSGRAKEHMS
jgi:putative hydrolase of the HAD superfamily